MKHVPEIFSDCFQSSGKNINERYMLQLIRKQIHIKSILILFFIVSIALSGKLSAQEVLNNYIQTAAENNVGLKAGFNEYMAALERIPQVGALPDPSVAFAYFIQPVETRLGPQQAKISASQMFPWFGALSDRENTAEALAKAKYESFKEAKSKLIYDVKATYYNLFFTEKAINITITNIEILSSFKTLANVKIESGSSSAIDAYQVEMEINDLENQLALLKDNLSVLKVKFNKLMNVEMYSPVEIPEKISHGILLSKQAELDSILLNNNALASFDYQLESLEYQENSVKKEGLPQFNIGLEYVFVGVGSTTIENSGQDAFMFPRVGLTIPLYRSKYKAKEQELIYLKEVKSYEKADKENALTILFENIWKDYSDADRRYSLYQKQTELAQMSFSVLEANYSTGSADFEDILMMERKLLKYSLELQKATTDREAAIAYIRYLQGK